MRTVDESVWSCAHERHLRDVNHGCLHLQSAGKGEHTSDELQAYHHRRGERPGSLSMPNVRAPSLFEGLVGSGERGVAEREVGESRGYVGWCTLPDLNLDRPAIQGERAQTALGEKMGSWREAAVSSIGAVALVARRSALLRRRSSGHSPERSEFRATVVTPEPDGALRAATLEDLTVAEILTWEEKDMGPSGRGATSLPRPGSCRARTWRGRR